MTLCSVCGSYSLTLCIVHVSCSLTLCSPCVLLILVHILHLTRSPWHGVVPCAVTRPILAGLRAPPPRGRLPLHGLRIPGGVRIMHSNPSPLPCPVQPCPAERWLGRPDAALRGHCGGTGRHWSERHCAWKAEG